MNKFYFFSIERMKKYKDIKDFLTIKTYISIYI